MKENFLFVGLLMVVPFIVSRVPWTRLLREFLAACPSLFSAASRKRPTRARIEVLVLLLPPTGGEDVLIILHGGDEVTVIAWDNRVVIRLPDQQASCDD